MLDDVRLTGCAEGDVPAGSKQLSRDFERDLCGWYPDQSASLNCESANGQKPSIRDQTMTTQLVLVITCILHQKGAPTPHRQPDLSVIPSRANASASGITSMVVALPEPAVHFSWVRTTGEQAVGSASPPTDHTMGTDQGYYLSAQLWKHPLGSRGSMLTQVNEPTAESGQCWMFWYHMAGRDSSSLSVYLQQSNNSSTRVLLWSRSIKQRQLWRHSRATVFNPHSPYQVVFEAVVGDGQVKDIAIDDLSVLNGPCPPNGHYIVPVPQRSASQTAEIMSSTLLPSSDCTVSFYLFSHGNNSEARLTTRLRMVRNGDEDIILWGRSVSHGFHWQRAEITFSSTVKTKV
ncbi:hypothetical protein AOLI_G00112520 [Acnodon oligacanthus]